MGNKQSSAAPRLASVPLIPANALEPSRIELHTTDGACVHLSAPLSGTQAFTIRLPRKFLAEAIETLLATDTRGNSPTLLFPSPPTTPAHFSAWHALLAENVGSTVGVRGAHSLREERVVVGVHVPAPGDDTTEPLVFVRENHSGHAQKTTTHRLSDTELFLPLDRHTDLASTLARVQCDALPDSICVPVVVLAAGSGEGTLDVSYTTGAQQDISHSMNYVVNGSEATARGQVDESIMARVHAVIHNPLPFALHDVRVVLCNSGRRVSVHNEELPYTSPWWKAAPRRESHASDTDSSGGRSSDTASDTASESSDSCSEWDYADDSEERVEHEVKRTHAPFRYEIERPVSLRYLEATSIPLPDVPVRVNQGHMIGLTWSSNGSRMTCSTQVSEKTAVRNMSDAMMEGGLLWFDQNRGQCSCFGIADTEPKGDAYGTLGASGNFIHIHTSHFVRECGRSLQFVKRHSLVYEVSSERTTVMRLTNRRTDMGTEVKVYNKRKFSLHAPETTAKVFSANDFDKVPRGEGKVVSRRDSFGDMIYRLPPGAKEVLVLRDVVKKKWVINPISDEAMSVVEKLARSGDVAEPLIEALKEFVGLIRVEQQTQMEHSICRRRVDLLFKGLKQSAEDRYVQDDGEPSVEGDRKKFDKNMETIRELEGRIADLKNNLVEHETKIQSMLNHISDLDY